MSPGVSFQDVATRASAVYSRKYRGWVAGTDTDAVLDVPLKVPTEQSVMADVAGTLSWIAEWKQMEASRPVTVTWGTRRWSRVGTQKVPARVRIEGSGAIADVAGQSAAFAALERRCVAMRDALSDGDTGAVSQVLHKHAKTIGDMRQADFDVLSGVVRWLVDNPSSGRYIRELPVVGIDTKWIEKRRTMVQALVSTVTGRASLGLAEPPRLVRVRSLDAAMTIAGLSDVSARVEELATLDAGWHTAIITENVQTFLALPERPGVLAIHGAGYAIDAVGRLPWVANMRLLYWGDLDRDGFRIVDRARAHGLNLETVLMDRGTLEDLRDLWVRDPSDFVGQLTRLTPAEQGGFDALREHGWPRLEQERVPWPRALEHLDRALGV